MQKTLACAAMLMIAGSLAGCGKDKHQESAKGGYDVQPRGHSVPTKTARAQPTEEEELDVESEWTTEPGMTPASGAQPMTPAAGTTPEAEGTATSPEELGAGGPIVLQFEGANHIARAVCEHETACGNIGPTEGWCEEVVKSQLMGALAECDQGLSRSELQECLSIIEQSSCEDWNEESAKSPCSAASLCAR